MSGQIQDATRSDVAWLPIVEYKTQWAHSDTLSGLRWYPDNSVRYLDLSWRVTPPKPGGPAVTPPAASVNPNHRTSRAPQNTRC